MRSPLSPGVRKTRWPPFFARARATHTAKWRHDGPGRVDTFQRPPSNRGTVMVGAPTVKADGRPVARNGDPADTCNDPQDAPKGQVVAVSTVKVGS
ncbi:MAG: PAAR domain-containing protein [Myxococcota bacterium]